jgi:hypothetical protein
MSDKINETEEEVNLKRAKDLMRRLEETKSTKLIQGLIDLLEDKLLIIRMERKIAEIKKDIYKGQRAAFAGQTMDFDEEQIVLTLEKASRKQKRLLEKEKRENSEPKKISEEQIEKLKSMGLYAQAEDEEETDEN